MLYLHIILLNRRVDLEGSCMMKDSEGGLSTFKFVQIKTGFEVPLNCVRNAWLEKMQGPILLRYLQITG